MGAMRPTAMNRADAEEYTDSLKQIVDGTWRQTALAAYRLGVPEALGQTPEQWLKNLPPAGLRRGEERREAVLELTAPEDEGGMGLSGRQAALVLGVDEGTVRNDKRAENSAHEQQNASNSAEFSAPEARPHVANNSGDNEWYTPAPYIEAARAVMGAIDLDPASSLAANKVVGAECFYTVDDDGLTQPWAGRIWLNPPYKQPAVDRFCTRVAREYAAGAITEAIVLTNNATETAFWQEMAAQAAAVCFPRGRVAFWHPEKGSAGPLQGQAVTYLGRRAAAFAQAFRPFGPVCYLWAEP